jgi:hypothetical protein
MKYIVLAAAAAAALLCGPAMAKVTFQTIDDPADPTFNQLLGINSSGTISGYYGSGAAGHPNKGYTVAPPYTAFTNQNFPKSAQTQVTGINSANSVVTVGFYSLTDLGGGQDANAGYVYANGKFKAVTDPLVTSSPPINQLLGIDTVGDAVGFYNDASGNSHAYTYNISTNASHQLQSTPRPLSCLRLQRELIPKALSVGSTSTLQATHKGTFKI